MADGTIAIDEPSTEDKLLDCEELTVGAETVLRERVQIAGAGATDLVLPVAHDAADAGNPLKIGGKARSSAPADVSATGDRVDAYFDMKGRLKVDASDVAVPVTDNGGSLTVDGSVTANAGTNLNTSALALEAGGNLAAAAASLGVVDDWDESDRAKVNPIAGQAGVAGGAGAVSALTQRVVLATDTTVPNVSGNVAHDSADAGNPVKIGGRADTTFQAAAADGDRVDALFDVYGHLFVRPHHANLWSFHENSSSALTDTEVAAAAGAGLSLYVTDIILSLGAATALNVFFEEGSTTRLGPYYLEAVNGRTIHIRFATPKKLTANTALTVTTSAAVAHSIDVHGFIAP